MILSFLLEGTHAKCQERATQYGRSTGSEEIEIRPMDNDEDIDVDDNHIYSKENFYLKDDDAYLPPTTGKFKTLFYT